MIRIEGLTKIYGEKKVIDEINLSLPDTGMVIIKGENGSGKSTLLNLIGGLSKSSSGEIVVDGIDITKMSESELSNYRETTVTTILQVDDLFENMSGRENIELFSADKTYKEQADFLEITSSLDKKVKDLSGGEKQKIAILRALTKPAKIILADEVTSSLDIESSEKVFELLHELSKDRLVVVVSHDEERAIAYADMVVILKGGKIAFENKKIILGKNEMGRFKNSFNSSQFVMKNMFINKKKTLRTGMLFFVIMLILLSAFVSLNIDFTSRKVDSLIYENENHFAIFKNKIEDNFYNSSEKESLEKEDVDYIKNEIDSSLVLSKKIYKRTVPVYLNVQNKDFGFSNDEGPSYYRTGLPLLSFVSSRELKEVIGNKPSVEDEIVITSYIADQIVKFGIENSDGVVKHPKSYDDLLGLEIDINNHPVKIVGIKKMDLNKYDILKESYDAELHYLFSYDVFLEGKLIYVRDEFYDYITRDSYEIDKEYDFKIEERELYNVEVFSKPVKTREEDVGILNRGEVILSAQLMEELNFDLEDYKDVEIDVDVQNRGLGISKLEGLKIVGISLDGKSYLSYEDVHDFLHKGIETDHALVRIEDKGLLKKLLDSYGHNVNYAKYDITTKFDNQFAEMENFYKKIKPVLIVSVILFTVLLIILLAQYVSTSINKHRKDIAILKTWGVRAQTIRKLFALEVAFIITCSYAFSLLFFMLSKTVVNKLLTNHYLFNINLIKANIYIIVAILIIVLVIMYIISLLSSRRLLNIECEDVFKDNTK